MMADGLRQSDALAHAFAVTVNLAVSGFGQLHARQGIFGKAAGFLIVEAVQTQPVANEITSGHAGWKGIELRTVTHNARQLFRLRRSDAQNTDGAIRWPNEA